MVYIKQRLGEDFFVFTLSVLVVVFCYAVCTRKNWYFRENQSIVIFKDDLKEEFIIKIKKNGFCSNICRSSVD